MKRLAFLLLSICFAVSLTAQSDTKLRPKYVNISYASQETKQNGVTSPTTKYGAGFTVGRTYYICKNKPILGMIRFGIDATWLDMNYGHYNYEEKYTYNYGEYEIEKYKIHQAEIGMQVGPSVTINPVSKLNVHAYFRYVPCFAGLYDGHDFRGDYGSFFVTGATVSYGVIGLGIEKRWGESKYKAIGGSDDDEYDYGYDYDYNYGSKSSSKLKTSGFRAYVSFRF